MPYGACPEPSWTFSIGALFSMCIFPTANNLTFIEHLLCVLNSRDIKKSIFDVKELVQFHFVRLFYGLDVSEFRNFVSVAV